MGAHAGTSLGHHVEHGSWDELRVWQRENSQSGGVEQRVQEVIQNTVAWAMVTGSYWMLDPDSNQGPGEMGGMERDVGQSGDDIYEECVLAG